MDREEIKKYINMIKNLDMFIKHCNKFHRDNKRDLEYVIARHIISTNPKNIYHMLAGTKLIIVTWNSARYNRLPKNIRTKLEKDILDAYIHVKDDLDELENKKLEFLDLNTDIWKKKIRRIFREFSTKRSIGNTGATKMLHVINPNIFLMWDTKIRKIYHELHSERHRIGDSECYWEFLRQSQEIVKAILRGNSEEEIWGKHLTSLDNNFIRTFRYRESLLKMLDECNYSIFKQPLKFDEEYRNG